LAKQAGAAPRQAEPAKEASQFLSTAEVKVDGDPRQPKAGWAIFVFLKYPGLNSDSGRLAEGRKPNRNKGIFPIVVAGRVRPVVIYGSTVSASLPER